MECVKVVRLGYSVLESLAGGGVKKKLGDRVKIPRVHMLLYIYIDLNTHNRVRIYLTVHVHTCTSTYVTF